MPFADITVNSLSFLILEITNTTDAKVDTGNTLTNTSGMVRNMRGAIAASSFPVGASRSNNESETLIQIIREKTIVKKKNDKLHSFSMYLSNVAMTSYCVAPSLIKIFMILPP